MSNNEQHRHRHKQHHHFSEILHCEVATLARNLRNAGLSPKNCMVVIRVGREFFVSASGISAADQNIAIEDFAQMIRASFDNDVQVIEFLDKIRDSLSHAIQHKGQYVHLS